MPTVVFVTNERKSAEVDAGTNLLVASMRHKGGIPFLCGGGKCGTCRCHIDEGLAHTDAIKAKERNHLTEEELAAGFRMACQTFVSGDVAVSWIPRPPGTPPGPYPPRPRLTPVAAAPSASSAPSQPSAPSAPPAPPAPSADPTP